MDLGRYKGLKLAPKSTKNQFEKVLETRSNFGWILDGSWVDFCSILDLSWEASCAKLAPSCYKNRSQNQSKNLLLNNLKKIKPNYVVHGDDWKKNIQSSVRAKLLLVMNKWKGKVLDIPYTKNISSMEEIVLV